MKSGGSLLVECLLALGAQKCFGVPGESYLDVLDALHDTKGRLDFILCRNEGGAAFMAEAWGKLTGTPGICMVTRGPGVTNASIGIHTAMQDSTPMLVFVGQVAREMKGREAFQEIDYRAVFGTMAKWAVEIDDVERIPEILSRAWTTALTGRPGPVVIALPEDMLTSMTDKPACKPVAIAEAAPRKADIDTALAMLDGAERPLILAGGGGWSDQGKADLRRFAETANIPVLSAFRFHDVIANDSACYAGDAGVGMVAHVRQAIVEADLVLALNIRFGEMTTDGWSLFDVPNPRQKLIHAHASDREIGKVYSADLPVYAGPNEMAAALAAGRAGAGDHRAWCGQRRQAYLDGLAVPGQPGDLDMGAVIAHLRAVLPEDTILTNGAGNFAIWPNKHLPVAGRMRLLAPQSGAMGYGVPAAVAARLAEPQRTVLCFAGDGDFQMNCQELGTAMQHGAQPVILIVNNGTYGTIRMHQERHYPARVSGTELQNPDFVQLARAYGFHGERVEKTADFAAAFARALASKTGAVLDLVISKEALTPKQTLSEMRAAGLKSSRQV
ncbi:MAG: thiamine pyrophosphate-binding protein [Nitratireductor sp.]|nr:thiamine pyrophosphate-binding protein [Nitratireductor sp.]